MEFKVGQKILRKVERENSPFQGKNRTEPNQSFKILEDFLKTPDKRQHDFKGKSYRKAITDLRKLLTELTGIKDDPFYDKQGQYQPYKPRFTVEFREHQIRDDDSGYTNKSVSYEDGVTGYTPNFEDENDIYQ